MKKVKKFQIPANLREENENIIRIHTVLKH